MQVLGLTGGIASGKSTVRRMLTELGARVLDADAIYHELIAPVGGGPSPLVQEIAQRFVGVVKSDGSLDRKRLGERVFKDADERQALGRITHPAIAQETARRMQALAEEGVPTVFYDVPLLFERDLQGGMDGVVVVWVPEAVQLARLMQRDGLSRDEAKERLGAQLPLDEKRGLATWVIDNSGDLEATRAQVERLYRSLPR